MEWVTCQACGGRYELAEAQAWPRWSIRLEGIAGEPLECWLRRCPNCTAKATMQLLQAEYQADGTVAAGLLFGIVRGDADPLVAVPPAPADGAESWDEFMDRVGAGDVAALWELTSAACGAASKAAEAATAHESVAVVLRRMERAARYLAEARSFIAAHTNGEIRAGDAV